MSEYKISKNFSKIKSEASSDLTFSMVSDGVIQLDTTNEVKCTIVDELLLIESKPCMNLNFGGGGSSFISFSGGMSISGNNISFGDQKGGKVRINGRLVDLDNLPNDENNEEKDTSHSKKWTFINPTLISRLTANGSGKIEFANCSMLSTKLCTTLSGSGGFYLPSGKYDTIKAKLSGSGTIHLGCSEIDNVDADLSGSGYMVDSTLTFCVLKYMNFSDIFNKFLFTIIEQIINT